MASFDSTPKHNCKFVKLDAYASGTSIILRRSTSSISLSTQTHALYSPHTPTTAHRLFTRLRRFMLALFRTAALTLFVLSLVSWIGVASAAIASIAAIAADSPNQTLQFGALVLESSTAHVGVDVVVAGNSSAVSPLAIIAANGSAHSNTNTNSNSNSNSNNNFNFNFSSISPPVGGLSPAATAAAYITTNVYDALSGEPTNVSIAPAEAETEGEFVMPSVQAIIVSIVLLFVIIGTVVGNILVCIAVCMVRKLRRPCNYLLVSLALSDLCVAVLVMPIALLYEVLEKWNFGPLLCDIWVSFDVLCCTASILNLCAISVDRYLAITKPLEYGVKRTPRRMMLCVALVWLAAACISLPPLLILGNEHRDEHSQPICAVCQNFAYQIYATLGSFYIPLAVMLFVYYQIFRAARRIVLEEKRAQTHLQHALNGTGSPPPGTTDLGSGNGQRNSSYGNASLTYSTCGHGGGSGGGVSGSSNLLGSPHQKKLRFQLAKEKKASTTLGIIMSAFTICWLPFFILALIRPFVESERVPQSLSSLFLWLGYANSLLNPIIYATLNRDFRKPFQEILYFRCSSLNTMMRENYYQDQYGEPPSQRVMLGDERHGARESFL